MIFGRHINRYYLKYGLWLLLGLLTLVAVDYLQLIIPNLYQMLVNGIRDYEVTIIDVHLSWMNNERFPYGGAFFVYANELLCSYLNVPCPSFPWSSFRAYLRYNLYDDYPGLLAKLSAPEEYASLLAREIESERQRCQKRVSSIFKYLPLPNRIKTKLVTRIVKSKVRHLLG